MRAPATLAGNPRQAGSKDASGIWVVVCSGKRRKNDPPVSPVRTKLGKAALLAAKRSTGQKQFAAFIPQTADELSRTLGAVEGGSNQDAKWIIVLIDTTSPNPATRLAALSLRQKGCRVFCFSRTQKGDDRYLQLKANAREGHWELRDDARHGPDRMANMIARLVAENS